MLDREIFGRMYNSFNDIVKSLKDMGYNTDRDLDNFHETPMRATKAFTEIIIPKKEVLSEIDKHCSKVFDSEYSMSNMIVQNGFTVISMCPHHLIPISLKVTVGYIPDNKVLGLSKMIRIATALGKQPILQEDFTVQLVNVFMDKLNAIGAGAYVEGLHGCMYCRGVRVKSNTITTSLKGTFLEDIKVKEEFLHYIK